MYKPLKTKEARKRNFGDRATFAAVQPPVGLPGRITKQQSARGLDQPFDDGIRLLR
jgi:hypothetical protein